MEVEPPVLEGTPALLAQGRLRSRVGSFPEARPVLGEVTETLCAAGTEDLRWGGCGCFPRASHTPGESPFVCRGVVVGAFPGRDIPRARVPFRPDDICVLD